MARGRPRAALASRSVEIPGARRGWRAGAWSAATLVVGGGLVLVGPPANGQSVEAPPASEAAALPTAAELFHRTLGVDIDTASYFELVAWAEELGLDDGGGRRDLQERLRLHFDLPDDRVPRAPPGRIIKIESAQLSEYFTLEEIGETYVRLRGGVLIRVDDREAGAVHSISAEEVVYNQQTESLTARGEVEYRLVSGGTEEVFHGESLTFDVATTEATFLRGSTEREHSTGTETVNFQFAGDRIVRLADDTVVLDRGRITSSPNPDEPNYEIRASQMWILAPNEWALREATLYVGRIPVFYLPFFFRPGDELFFHPSISVDDQRGTVLHTTTYLIGRRVQQDTPFSFLRTSDDAQYEESREGLFLRKVPGTATSDAPPATDDGRFLKLMLDLYSRSGAFAGFEGSLPGAVGSTQLTIKGGLGVSRSLRFDDAIGFTPYFIDTSNNAFSIWHTVDWLGLAMPLRYALEVDFSRREASGTTLDAALEWFSDPRFPADFYNRQERIDWPALVGLPGDPPVPASERSTLTWQANARVDFALAEGQGAPGATVERFSMPTLNTRLFWQSRTDTSDYCAEVAPLFGDPTCGDLNGGGAIANLDPTREFYYPSTLRVPLLSLSLAGTLLELPHRDGVTTEGAASADAIAVPGRGLRGFGAAASAVPGMHGEPVPSASVATPRPPRDPVARRDAPKPMLAQPVTASLSYSLTPTVTIEETFDSEPWVDPGSVDFSPLYATAQLTETAALAGEVSIYNGLLDVRTRLSNSSTYQTRFARGTSLLDGLNKDGTDDNGDEDDAAWTALVRADLAQIGTSFSTANTFTLAPLLGSALLADSSITYDLDLNLYQVSFDAAATSNVAEPIYLVAGPEWTSAGVNQHSLQARLVLQTGDFSQSLTLAASLPPTSGLDLAATLALASAFVSGRLATSVDENLQFDLLRAGVTLRVGEQLSFRQELDTDVQRPAIDRLSSTLTYGDLSATAVARYMVALDPSGLPLGTPGLDEQLLLQQLRFGYAFTGEPLLLWHNRVQLAVGLKTAWSINLQDFINNAFTFDLSFNFSIHEFLELALTMSSLNDRTYRYLPGLPEKIGQVWVNPLQDLWWSFQFWNPDNRRKSEFNLQRLSLRLVHSLEDWNLTFEYGGSYQPDAAATSLEWSPLFSLMVQWIPVPEISSELSGGDTFSIGS